MHSNGKGMSDSAIPYKRTADNWVTASSEEIKNMSMST